LLLQSGALRLACLAVFILNTGYGMVLPLLPVYARELGADVLLVGAMVSAFAFARMVLQVPGGLAADRLGPRNMAVAAMVLYAVPVALFAVSSDPGLLVGWRALQGVAEGLGIPALGALIVRYTRPEQRGEAYGTFTAFATAGLGAGPVLGGIIAGLLHWRMLFWLSCGASLLAAALLGVLRTREGSPAGESSAAGPGAAAPDTTADADATAPAGSDVPGARVAGSFGGDSWFSFLGGGRWRVFFALAALAFMGQFVYGAIEGIFPLYLDQVLAAGMGAIGAMFTINFVLFTVTQPPLGRAADRVGGLWPGAVGSLAICGSLLLLGLVRHTGLWLAVFGVEVLAGSAVYVFCRKLVADNFADTPGRAFGLMGALADVGLLLGPMAASLAFRVEPRLMFVVLAACALGAGLIAGGSAVAERRAAGTGRADSAGASGGGG